MSEKIKHRKHYIVWLKTRIDAGDEELEKTLSKTYTHFQLFQEVNACINFISDLPSDFSSVFLILVDIQYEYLSEMLIDLRQLAHIYLYDRTKTKEELTSSDRKFIRFSTNNSKDLFYAITRDIELNEGIPSILGSSTSNSTFVLFQLLIEVIRQLPHTITAKEEMFVFLNEYFQDSPVEREQLNQFVQEYKSTDVVFGYTKADLLFRVLNRAVRTENIDNI